VQNAAKALLELYAQLQDKQTREEDLGPRLPLRVTKQ
jgi:hypothetical protein